MEPFEDMHQFLGRDADARVAHSQLNRLIALLQRYFDFAREREFECIREQIQNNLLPHITIDINRLIKACTIDHESQTRSFNRRAKDTGNFCREGGDIRRLIDCLNRPASMREKSSNVFTSFNKRRPLRCASSNCSRRSASARPP